MFLFITLLSCYIYSLNCHLPMAEQSCSVDKQGSDVIIMCRSSIGLQMLCYWQQETHKLCFQKIKLYISASKSSFPSIEARQPYLLAGCTTPVSILMKAPTDSELPSLHCVSICQHYCKAATICILWVLYIFASLHGPACLSSLLISKIQITVLLFLALAQSCTGFSCCCFCF